VDAVQQQQQLLTSFLTRDGRLRLTHGVMGGAVCSAARRMLGHVGLLAFMPPSFGGGGEWLRAWWF
jgi:hypothetical protein